MPLHNPLANCETDAGAGIFAIVFVKPFENTEYAVPMFGRNSDTIVTNCKSPLPSYTRNADVNARRLPLATVLDRISNQVLK